MMTLRQQKTNKDVFVPMHPLWTEAIASVPKREMILYDKGGENYTTEGVQAFLRRLMREIGFTQPDGQASYTFHGLRKNSANLLAGIGCTPHEISSITGMSLDMVIHYTKAINMKLVAERIADRYRDAVLPGQVTAPILSGNATPKGA
jgi:integrase